MSNKPRVLILDDQLRYPTEILLPKLRDEYEVKLVRDATLAHRLLSNEHFELAILDLVLDEPMPAVLSHFAGVVDSGLRNAGQQPDLSAQALGLWLWSLPPTKRTPYCYLTSFRRLWVKGLRSEGGGNEFDDADQVECNRLVCERGEEGDPGEFVKEILSIWRVRGWLESKAVPASSDGL